MMYNDAYVPILGNRHPAALGRAQRASVVGHLGRRSARMLASVIATGKADLVG